jgi:hypothetical protein
MCGDVPHQRVFVIPFPACAGIYRRNGGLETLDRSAVMAVKLKLKRLFSLIGEQPFFSFSSLELIR